MRRAGPPPEALNLFAPPSTMPPRGRTGDFHAVRTTSSRCAAEDAAEGAAETLIAATCGGDDDGGGGGGGAVCWGSGGCSGSAHFSASRREMSARICVNAAPRPSSPHRCRGAACFDVAPSFWPHGVASELTFWEVTSRRSFRLAAAGGRPGTSAGVSARSRGGQKFDADTSRDGDGGATGATPAAGPPRGAKWARRQPPDAGPPHQQLAPPGATGGESPPHKLCCPCRR